MKNKLVCFVLLAMLGLSACSDNRMATKHGGTKEIKLPDGMKFVNYNIQDDGIIWCTYRPMRSDETPETFIVQQDKGSLAVGRDGKFVVYESKDGKTSDKLK